jgi:hypothetical protein
MPKIVGNITGRGSTTPREFSVRNYGAVGDGVTNDYTAIAAAISACGTAGGGTVIFPPGHYIVSTNGGFQLPVQGSGSMKLKGMGQEVTRITFSGTGYLFTIGDSGATDSRYQYIEDMTLIGTATNPDGAVKFNHQRFCGLRTVLIKDFTKAGARGVDIVTLEHNYFALIDQCKFINVPTGIYMESDAGGVGANSNHVRQCHFGVHSSYAIHIVGGDTNTVEYCEFNGSVTTAIRIEGAATNSKLLYNQFDGPATSVQITANTVASTMIIGNSGSATISDSGSNTTVLAAGTMYARNGLILGGASGDPATVPLRLRGGTSQSTNIFQIQSSTGGSTYLSVDQSGNFTSNGSGLFHAHTILQADVGVNSVVATVDQQGAANSATGLRVKQRSTGTTGDMQRWVASDGTTVYSRVNKDGYIGTMKTTAPADGDINTSEVFLWLDDTAAAPKLMAKGKDSAGTVFSHQLSP